MLERSLYNSPRPHNYSGSTTEAVVWRLHLYNCNIVFPQTRQKVLVTAFLRALKDPFPPARSAAIGSLAATHSYYTTGDVAGRILPALCTLTLDKEKEVRDQVFTTIKMFLSKMEKISEDPHAAAEQEKAEGECARRDRQEDSRCMAINYTFHCILNVHYWH